MENEAKIFTAWLKKALKKDKLMTGKALANLVGCSPSTITSYLNGRTIPNLDIQGKIQQVVNIPRQKILEIGRQELNPMSPLENRIASIEAQIPSFQMTATATPENELDQQGAKKNAKHHEIIDRFQNHELATAINIGLVELEQYSADELEEIKDLIDSKLKRHKKRKDKAGQETGTSDPKSTGTE